MVSESRTSASTEVSAELRSLERPWLLWLFSLSSNQAAAMFHEKEKIQSRNPVVLFEKLKAASLGNIYIRRNLSCI